jgi:hypothetical protein
MDPLVIETAMGCTKIVTILVIKLLRYWPTSLCESILRQIILRVIKGFFFIDIEDKYKTTTLGSHSQATKKEGKKQLTRLDWGINTGTTQRPVELGPRLYTAAARKKTQPQRAPTSTHLKTSGQTRDPAPKRSKEG